MEQKKREENDMREKILEQLKEEEKEQRQEKYEEKLEDAVKEVSQLVLGERWKEIEERVENIMDMVQKMAFTEGYIYAIATLEEGLAHMV